MITPNHLYQPEIQIFAIKILSNSKTGLKWIAHLIDILPEAGIIGEAEKIADMRWIREVFGVVISPES
jgi:hypothetical protein